MSTVPIPDAPESEKNVIRSLVERCLGTVSSSSVEAEEEIEARVARLFGQSEKETSAGIS